MMKMVSRMSWRAVVGLAVALAACANGSSAAPGQVLGGRCTVAGGARSLAELPEASGVAVSRRTAGLLWSHNDSGLPALVAFDATGATRGHVRIPNATVDDWEDVTAAPCPAGNCLYIADIGDNEFARRDIRVYRVPEPSPGDRQTAAAEIFTFRYPDGAHNAEALFVHDDEIFILTKAATTAMYRAGIPAQAAQTAAPLPLERAGELPLRRVTDAEASPDGAWVAVRTNEELVLYRTSELVRGVSKGEAISLKPLKEPQGEGVALDANGMLYLTSEGGNGHRAGSVTTLRCTLEKQE